MAFQKFGDGSYRFSLDSVEAAAIKAAVGLTPQKISFQGEPEFMAEAIDEEGLVAAMAVAQDKKTFTMEGYITDLALFEATGASFTFDGNFYVVTGRNREAAPREYEKGTMTGVYHAGITAVVP